jgi:hypothetical protein
VLKPEKAAPLDVLVVLMRLTPDSYAIDVFWTWLEPQAGHSITLDFSFGPAVGLTLARFLRQEGCSRPSFTSCAERAMSDRRSVARGSVTSSVTKRTWRNESLATICASRS